jgi:hypothetical protein
MTTSAHRYHGQKRGHRVGRSPSIESHSQKIVQQAFRLPGRPHYTAPAGDHLIIKDANHENPSEDTVFLNTAAACGVAHRQLTGRLRVLRTSVPPMRPQRYECRRVLGATRKLLRHEWLHGSLIIAPKIQNPPCASPRCAGPVHFLLRRSLSAMCADNAGADARYVANGPAIQWSTTTDTCRLDRRSRVGRPYSGS